MVKMIFVASSVLIALTGLSVSPAPADQIPFTGLEAEHQGAAAWNADGVGPEAAKTGHALTWITCRTNAVAYYYLASRDFGGIDPASSGGVHGVPAGLTGFSGFASVLSANGFTIKDLTVSWGLQTLGDDVEGQDWFFDSPVETRFYRDGNFIIKLGGEDMVGGIMPRTTVIADYRNLNDCLDDRILGHTDPVRPVNRSAASSVAVQAVAAAFLNGLGGDGIRFIFDSFQPAIQLQFGGNGRTGAFFEIQSGGLETAPPLPEVPLAPSGLRVRP